MLEAIFQPGVQVSSLLVAEVVGSLPEVERVVELAVTLVLATSAVDDVVDKALCLRVNGFIEEGHVRLSVRG